MTMTDPIADMLTRIRNANTAMHDDVSMPCSNLKAALAKVLEKEGYIAGYTISDAEGRPGQTLRIDMKYSPDRQRVISGVRRVSTPGLRVYTKAERIPRVLGGLGVAIVSTSKGLMTDREARKRRMGGEVLCYVW
jgi:small subunit ribosomal protein S8